MGVPRERPWAARDPGNPADPVLGPFGAGRFRSRLTDAVWQGPTWSFAILLVVLRLVEDHDGLHRGWFVLGACVVMAMTLVAVLAPWRRLPASAQAVVPLGDLVGASVLVLADPSGAAGTFLLCALPVVWLAFEFARWGLAVALVVTGSLGLVASLAHPTATQAASASGVGVSALFVVGLGVVARLMGGVLHRVGETLVGQACEVEAARALAQERLDLVDGVLASIDVGVVVLHPDRPPRLNHSARAAVARMGMTPDGLGTGGPHVYADHAHTPVPPEEQVARRAETGEDFAGVVQWIGEPGDQRVVVCSARRLTGPDGEQTASVLAMWDATDLVDAIQVREDFLTTVSHELRTPLTAIAASVEVLVEEASCAGEEVSDTTRLLGAVSRNTMLLRTRIDELLTSAHVAEHPLSVVRTDVTALLRAALGKHDHALRATGVVLTDEIEEGVRAELDPTLFEQAADNLVSNAVKYSAPGASVTVSLRLAGPQLVLTVEDDGVGMSSQEQRQAFDRFYRAPRARAGAVQGLGVGLSVVRSIVERHHGTIDLRSTSGAGTTVTVRLPVSAAR